MADRWLRVPRTGLGTDTDPFSPEYADQLDGFSGQILAQSPRYLIRAYADTATLDSIEAENDVQALTNAEVENALNSLFDAGRNIDGWERGFNEE
jgi:hypothetical protein